MGASQFTRHKTSQQTHRTACGGLLAGCGGVTKGGCIKRYVLCDEWRVQCVNRDSIVSLTVEIRCALS